MEQTTSVQMTMLAALVVSVLVCRDMKTLTTYVVSTISPNHY